MLTGNEPWLYGHSHEPNPVVPSGDGRFALLAGSHVRQVSLADLSLMPLTEVGGCYITSTGHGRSGPFLFGGVRLVDLLHACCPECEPSVIDVISTDGFGTRLAVDLLRRAEGSRAPLILAWQINRTPLRREQGLVRLIVPQDTDDALRQVKWVDRVVVHCDAPR